MVPYAVMRIQSHHCLIGGKGGCAKAYEIPKLLNSVDISQDNKRQAWILAKKNEIIVKEKV